MNTQLNKYLKSIEKKKLESNSQNNFNLLKYFDKTSKNFLRILSKQYNRIISSIFYEGYTFGFNIHCFMYNSKENDKNISKYNTEDLENKYRNVHLLPLPYISNSKTYDGLKRFAFAIFIFIYYTYYINCIFNFENDNENMNKLFKFKSCISIILFHTCINTFIVSFILGICFSFTIYKCLFRINHLNESFEHCLHFLKTCQLLHIGRQISSPILAPVSRLECSLYERHSPSTRMHFISMKNYRHSLSTILQKLENDVKEISGNCHNNDINNGNNKSCSKSKFDGISSFPPATTTTTTTSPQLLLYELEKSYSNVLSFVMQDVLSLLLEKVNAFISNRRNHPFTEIVRDCNLITDVGIALSTSLKLIQLILDQMKNFYKLEKKKETKRESSKIATPVCMNITRLKKDTETLYHRLCLMEELLNNQNANDGENENNLKDIGVEIEKIFELNEANSGLQDEMQEWQTQLSTMLLHHVQQTSKDKRVMKKKKNTNLSSIQLSDGDGDGDDGSGRDDTSSVMVHHESEVVTFSGTKLSNNQENEEDLDDVVDIYTAMVVDNVSTTSENISIDDIDSDLALKEKDFLLQAKINAMSLKELRDVIQTRPTRRERIKALGKIKSEIEEEYSETTMDIVGISTGNDIESVDHRDITRKASTMSRVLSPNCLNELRTQMKLLQTRNNQEEEFCFDEDFAEI